MQNIVRELKQAIEKDSLVVFCGSGTSSYLGLPNWKKLVINIINEISIDAPRFMPLVDLLENDVINPLMVLDLLEDEYKDIITGVLAKTLVFDKKLKCSLQEKILAISEKIITTNYDKAFENASDIPNVIFNDGKFKLAKISDNKSFIFKIHGDISNPEDCILFTKQYQKLYQDEAFLLGLKILFIQKTVLFIGFSLNDPFIVEIINAITRAYDSFNRRHYIITTDAMFNKEKFRGIVHPHLLNSYCELEDFLDSLLKYKKKAKSFAHVHNLKGGPDNLHIWNKEQFEAIIQCILNLRPVTVILGQPGSGKTSLAREIAYLCLGKSKMNIASSLRFDYIVWFSLNDCLRPNRVLNALFDEIGRVTGYIKITHINVDNDNDKTSLKEKQTEINRILTEHKVFIIIDNFQLSKDADLKSWIETVEPPSEILITSSKDVGFTNNVYCLTGLSQEDFRKFIHQEAQIKDMDIDKDVTPDQLEKIYSLTSGNPQAILLVLGLLNNNAYKNNSLIKSTKEISLLFDILYAIAHEKLSAEAKKLLDFFPLLAEKTSIEREALKEISGFEWECFHKCIVELSAWNLIYFDLEDRYYRLHPTLIQYLQHKKTSTVDKLEGKTKDSIKERYIQYYLMLVETNIKRNYPDEDYWNCLVSPKMAVLDTRVSSILKAVEWAAQISGQEGNYLKLIKYLIHYLDSRFYNRSRMEFVKRAIEICKATGDWYLEALFKIDALGWTCVEENQFKLAEQSILAGCSILEAHTTDGPEARRVDLKALAQAWLARVKLEQYKKPKEEKPLIEEEKILIEAEELIKEALLYTGGRPWIQYRIYMVSGDIFYRKQEFDQSLKYYKLAKNEINSYGGEGGNYQINPRLGLAYLSIGTERYLQEAENIFTALKQNHNILIGKLYGEFGLAMIDYKRGNRHETKELVARLEEDITKRSPDNLLLKLIKLYKSETLDKNGN